MKSLAFAIQDSQVADNFAMDLGKLLPKVKEEQTGIDKWPNGLCQHKAGSHFVVHNLPR